MRYEITYMLDGLEERAEVWAEDDDSALTKARIAFGPTAKVFRAKF